MPAATVDVRRAGPSATRAVRMLLPDAFYGSPPELFVATEAERILGAAALVPSPSGHNPAGFPLWLKVARPYRRQGVGRALVRAVSDEARRWNAEALRLGTPVEEGSELAFAEAVGFSVVRRQLTFQVDFLPLYGVFRPVLEKLRRRIPASARLVSLREAPAADLARFHERHLGGFAERLVRRIQGADAMSFSPDISRVLLIDGEIKGLLFASLDGDALRGDSRIIDPEYRGRWASVLLLTSAMDAVPVRDHATVKVRFACYDDNRDTLKLARRAGAEVRKVHCLCALRLGGALPAGPSIMED